MILMKDTCDKRVEPALEEAVDDDGLVVAQVHELPERVDVERAAAGLDALGGEEDGDVGLADHRRREQVGAALAVREGDHAVHGGRAPEGHVREG